MNHLPHSTIRLLGSTQVITSVYSVVKELVENSLDAGATSIEVKLENYGLEKIEVRDNGSGICAADISVLAKHHYTSKITSVGDLETLGSYGFRGEALGYFLLQCRQFYQFVGLTLNFDICMLSASLCAVSEMTVTTKTIAEDISLTYYFSSEGDITNTTPSHFGQGTTVCAKNLFVNLPVRKQSYSLKQKKEDLKNVENLLVAYGIILPNVRFSLYHNKGQVWRKGSFNSSDAALCHVLGKDIMKQMVWKKTLSEDSQMELELCVPKPGSDISSLSRSTPDKSFLCINGRPVAVRNIDKLIRQYYNNCQGCETNRHPLYYLGITVPSKDLDVNFDPNKTTVMMSNMHDLTEQLEEMLLYLYGPLDQAPWRYRDADNGSNKSSTSDVETNKSSALVEQLRKNYGDPGSHAQSSTESSAENTATAPISGAQPSTESCSENTGAKQSLARLPTGSKHKPFPGSMEQPQTSNRSEDPQLQASTEVPVNAKPTPDAAGVFEGPSKDQQEKDDRLMQNHDGDSEFSGNTDKGCEQLRHRSVETLSANRTVNEDGPVKEQKPDSDSTAPATTQHTDEKMDSDLPKNSSQTKGQTGWSHGTSIHTEDGATVQPVHLLTPATVQLCGKRRLSPSSNLTENEMVFPQKCGRRLSPAQATLYDTVNNTAVKRPLSARDFFMKEQRSVVVEQNPHADYEEITNILVTLWNQLAEEQRIVFREKCWHDTQRYNKEVAAAKRTTGKGLTSISNKARQVSVRDMVAAACTQPSPKRSKKENVTGSTLERRMSFSLSHLQHSLSQTSLPSQDYFVGTRVLASLPSCNAWVCGKGRELCILNVHRLSEAIVYGRLMDQHCLPVHHCQTVALSPSNTGGYWSVLKELAENQESEEAFTKLSDSRLTHNGFDVKYWTDGQGSLCAELVGMCGDIPMYGVKDLVEILEIISKNTSMSLAQCRPIKVINFLKGEAVRIVRQQKEEKTMDDVQSLIQEGSSLLSAEGDSCIHDRPFFCTLLRDIDSPSSTQQSVENPCSISGMSQHCTEGDYDNVQSDDKALDQLMSIDELMDFD